MLFYGRGIEIIFFKEVKKNSKKKPHITYATFTAQSIQAFVRQVSLGQPLFLSPSGAQINRPSRDVVWHSF